jgi:hypothetical protein
MMEAVRTSETSVDNNFTRQYIPEHNSEHHTHRRENMKSHTAYLSFISSNLSLISDEPYHGIFIFFFKQFVTAHSDLICKAKQPMYDTTEKSD